MKKLIGMTLLAVLLCGSVLSANVMEGYAYDPGPGPLAPKTAYDPDPGPLAPKQVAYDRGGDAMSPTNEQA